MYPGITDYKNTMHQEQYRSGTCAFVGYSARAREYWNAQATAVIPIPNYKFGECPGCKAGMNAESDYVLVVGGDDEADTESAQTIVRCINCYEVMFMTGSRT